jgi:hypothetical protein
MKSDEKDVAQLRGNDLEARIRRATTNRFPKDQHLSLNNDMRLTQWLTVDVMDFLESGFAYFSRVQDKLTDDCADGVVVVCCNPTRLRWEACPDRAIHKRLDSGGGSGHSIGREQLAIGIPHNHHIRVNLVENPF